MSAVINGMQTPNTLELQKRLGTGTDLHGKVDSVSTNVSAIKALTDNLPVDTAAVLTAIEGSSFSSSTDSLHALKLRADTLDSTLSGIEGTSFVSATDSLHANKVAVAAIQSDVTAIKAKTDNLPANTTTRFNTIDSDVSGVKTVVDGIQSDLSNGTDGLTALKTLIDGVQATATAIQNNTRLTSSIPQEIETPVSGSNYSKFFINLYDSAGNKEDPDTDEVAIVLTQMDGTDVTATRLFKTNTGTALSTGTEFSSNKKMEKDSTGRYFVYYKNTNTDSAEMLNVQLKYNENAQFNGQDRAFRVVKQLGSGAATVANQLTIIDDVAAVKSDTATIKAVTNLLPDGGALSSLAQDSTVAKATALATVDTVVDAIKLVTDALPNGGALTSLAQASALTSAQGDITAIKALTDNLPANTTTRFSNLDTAVSNVKGDTAAIKALTDNLPVNTTSRLDSVDSAISGVDGKIGTPAAIDSSAATLAGMLSKIFGAGFTASSYSLKALGDAVAAIKSYPSTFGAAKATSAIAQSSSEVLEFSTSEGVLTNNATLKSLKVTVSGASTSLTVKIFEKTGTPGANLLYQIDGIDANGLNLDLNGLIYRNKDASVTNKIYVQVSNVADVSTSTVTVEVRGLLNAN